MPPHPSHNFDFCGNCNYCHAVIETSKAAMECTAPKVVYWKRQDFIDDTNTMFPSRPDGKD